VPEQAKKKNTANSAKCVIHMDQTGNIIVELTVDLLIGLSVDVLVERFF